MLAYLLAPYFKILKNQGTENNLLGVSKTCFSLRDEEVMILELGTNRKGEIETLSKIAAPDVGIITCVKPVHLEGLESLAGVFEEKISLLKSNSRMKLILNRDDPYLARVRRPGPVRSTKVTGRKNKTSNGVYWFGRDRNNYLFARMVKRSGGNSFFLIQDKYKLLLPSYAEGFIANVLAAIAGAKIKGVALAESAQRLGYFNNFSPLRMEQSGHKGFSILNDAYNANPYSFQMAFRGLKNCSLKKIAVIGDMLELGKKSKYYHELLAGQIIKSGFEYCLTLGKHTLCLNRKLRDLGCRKAFHFSSHRAIARFINKQFGRDAENKKRYLIFLKGSRKMELEKVIKYLR
jgi:UDP-N-acetylmuramoyl-tripeptide--D-alanyl-D-alanine ligase